jgi:micrococcal nuclease
LDPAPIAALAVALVFAAAIFYSATTALAFSPRQPRPEAASSIRVIDGDTVESPYGVKYRLLGFDTPEIFSAKTPQEYALGMQAKRRLEQLIARGTVRIIESGKLDRHGRSLATLTVNGRDVGETLIREGLARAYSGGKRLPW